MMAPAQAITSTATESSSRFTSSDMYRYDGTLHLTGTTTPPIPARRYTLNVNATSAGPSSGCAASASHDSERETTHDRHAQSQRQDGSHLQQARTRSTQSQYWSVRIAEIPIDGAEADAGSPAGFAHNRDSPPDHSHVGYYPELYASASLSVAGPSVPPSLARYALTPPAAQASSWRDTVIGVPSSSSRVWLPPPPPPFPASDAFRGFDTSTRWDSPPPPSSAEGVASTSFPLVHPSLALPCASPTHSNSPESTSGTAVSSSWASIPTATVDSEGSTRSRSASTYANNLKVSSSAPAAALPSLIRPSFASSSSSSSSSLQVSSFSGSGSNAASAPTTTVAAAVVGAASRVVPEPATHFALLPFTPRSPVSPQGAPEPDARFTSFAAAGQPQSQIASAAVSALTPPISSEQQQQQQQQQAHPSPPYASQIHSPASVRLARSDVSPVHEQQQREPAAFQVPLQASIETGDRAGASPSSGFGSVATASGPPGPGAANYLFVGTDTGLYYSPFGVKSDTPGAGPSSLAARSTAPLLTVPLAISAAEPFDYSPSSPPSAPAPVPASASASAAGSNSGQTTRKKNHACWMCHKSFDRPSTLRKHLLVHTGEKAFVCTICGRRFGVASNLNRHTRRCIARPVNSSAFHSASTPAAGPSTLATTLLATSDTDESMAREQTNPDVRRSERERDGREVRDGDAPPPAPATPTTSESSTLPTRGRRRGRSSAQSAPQGMNASLPPESGASSSQRTPFQLRPAFGGGGGGQGSGQVAVATASASTEDADSERRPKRRRRAPSPSRWVPASLRPFSLSPVRQRTSTPLPPVSPGYDAATGNYEERDSYATVDDENVDPAGEASAASSSGTGSSGSNMGGNAGRTRAERMRNFEYAPYHPCGWTGRLPGPAVVVGTDLTNYTKPSGGGGSGSGSGSGRYSGGHAAGSLSFMYEFSLAAEG